MITATCGHEIPDNSELYSVTCKDYTREGERCVTTKMVCMRCKRMLMNYGNVLYTKEQEDEWLYHGEGTA